MLNQESMLESCEKSTLLQRRSEFLSKLTTKEMTTSTISIKKISRYNPNLDLPSASLLR